MSTTVTVPLGERSYPICVGEGVLDQSAALLRERLPGSRVLLVADETVDGLYGDRVAALLSGAGYTVSRATVPAGEASKSGEWMLRLYERAADEVLDRKSAIVALGGGVVGDLAGFLAASYLRGIRLVQIPTTLLAMVDSAVGGKTGINLPQGKNLVGAFHQPVLVLCDIALLKSLPARELAAGLAEVIKYGVIRDAELFAFLERNMDAIRAGEPAALAHIVARSCAIKADVVSADEREAGERAILNYGHTLGHAVEQVAGYGVYLHGEAVGIGMAYAARVSVQAAGLAREDEARIVNVIQRAGLPVGAPGLHWADLRRAMAVDKKGAAGVPRFVLVKRIGAVEYGRTVPEATLEEAWHGGR